MKWDEYEEAVRDIQKKMGPDLDIQRDVIIKDGDGIDRQFDVVCKGNIQNTNVLYVTECKHRSRPVDMNQVEAFNQKAISVNANLKSIYSSKGFRKNALVKAKSYGINCYSICENGITVDNERTFGWYNFAKNVVVSLIAGEYELVGNNPSVKDGPLKVSDIDLIWFLRACVDEGVKSVAITSKPEEVFNEEHFSVSIKPRRGSKYFIISFGNNRRRCKRISAKVKVHPIVKMKFTPLSATGVYDHHKNSISLPKGEGVAGAVIDTHNYRKIFEEWDDATIDVLRMEKLLVFWTLIPPMPKAFYRKRYSIHVLRIAQQKKD